MIARREIYTIRSRLNHVAKKAADTEDLELQAQLASYICVLASGLIERSVQLIIMDYASRSATKEVQNFVLARMKRFTNAKTGKMIELFESFDARWADELKHYINDEQKAAINSIVGMRHRIAHGHSVDLSLARVMEYIKHSTDVIDHLLEICGCN